MQILKIVWFGFFGSIWAMFVIAAIIVLIQPLI